MVRRGQIVAGGDYHAGLHHSLVIFPELAKGMAHNNTKREKT